MKNLSRLKKVPKNLLPVYKNVKKLRDLEKKSMNALDLVLDSMMKEVISELQKEDLIKSELPKNWESKVPTIELSITDTIKVIVDKHLKALKAVLLGKAAGKEAWEALSSLNLGKEVPTGSIMEAYLGSLDSQKDQAQAFGALVELNPAKSYIQETIKFIQQNAGDFVDSSLTNLRGRIMSDMGQMIMQYNQEALNTVRDHMTASKDVNPTTSKRMMIKDALKFVKDKTLSVSEARQFLKNTTKDYAADWNRIVATELATANGVAASQVIQSIAGPEDPDVAIVNIDDEKVSPECKSWSRHEDGTLKVIKLSSLKPPGFNNGKKRNQWINCIPTRHINCRCHLVYIPTGFTVDSNGSLIKKTDGETSSLGSDQKKPEQT